VATGDLFFAASEAINLGAATALVTLDVAITGTTRRFSVNELGVSFNGTSASAVPVTVRLVRTTTAPVGGGTITQAPTPLDAASPASLCTAYMPTTATPGVYATTAPTVGVILRTWYVSPTSGLVIQYPLGQEPDSPSTPAASGFGIQCVAPAAVQCNSYLVWTE
jgi:hypothetical protein